MNRFEVPQVLDLPLPSGHTALMLLYKIFRADEMSAFLDAKETRGAPIDRDDGYVHLSAADQLSGTLAKHFAGEDNLTLLAIEADTLGDDLKWEVSRGNALFPHLYRLLRVDDVLWHKPLTAGNERSGFAAIWR